jgi:hypothetical protein
LSGLLLLVACEKQPVPLTTNSVITGVAYSGTTNTEEGITVVANGPYGKSSVVTDKNGHFTISGLGNGTYFLDFSKEGYGTIRQYNIQLFGSDTVRAVNTKLFKKPEVLKLPNFKAPYIGVRPRAFPERPWICIETDIIQQNAATYGFQLMLCLDTDENVSWDNNKIYDFSWDSQFNDNTCTFYIDPESLLRMNKDGFPFKSGDKVYVRGYPCNKDEFSGYIDTYLGVRQYSTLDKKRSTNVVSFIMP